MSGKAMARTGLRMMPTFPSPPLKLSGRTMAPGGLPRFPWPSLKFRTVSFPQYGFKAEYWTWPSQHAGLPSPLVLSAAMGKMKLTLLCDSAKESVESRGRAGDTQLSHAVLQCSALHPQTNRRAVRPAEHPTRIAKNGQNVLSLGLFQRVVLLWAARRCARFQLGKRDSQCAPCR